MAKVILILIGLLLLFTPAVLAAPRLTDADEQRLADGTSDEDDRLDQQDGFYVLLRSAAEWQGDDFSGDEGAKVAPPADFDYIKKHPAEVRGNVYLIEGWLAQHDRYPTKDNMNRDALMRAGDPSWGEQVTRWTIVTEEKDPGSTIIVLFNDPNAKMPKPGKNAKVKVAARFYKLWTIKNTAGEPFTYPVFIGGAAKVVKAGGESEAGGPSKTVITVALLMVAAAFFGLRFLMRRANATGKQRTAALVAARRRDRDDYEEQAEEDIDDLPDDPIAALDVLSKKHELNDQ